MRKRKMPVSKNNINKHSIEIDMSPIGKNKELSLGVVRGRKFKKYS